MLTYLRGIGLKPDGIARLPDTDSPKTKRSRFKAYPIGLFSLDIAEVHTEQGRLHLFVAISRQQTAAPIAEGARSSRTRGDRTSEFAVAQLHARATR